MSETATRSYNQVARAAATERTQRRIVEVFFELLRTRWLDEITLDAVAAGAETTRQTVIRLFGGKDRLITAATVLAYEQITGRRRLPPDASVGQIADVLVADYEIDGDMIIRMLAQEAQHPELSPLLNDGRAGHRTWVAEAFEEPLTGVSGLAREQLLDELVALTDVYLWKLFRRDLGKDRAQTVDLISRLLGKALGEAGHDRRA